MVIEVLCHRNERSVLNTIAECPIAKGDIKSCVVCLVELRLLQNCMFLLYLLEFSPLILELF